MVYLFHQCAVSHIHKKFCKHIVPKENITDGKVSYFTSDCVYCGSMARKYNSEKNFFVQLIFIFNELTKVSCHHISKVSHLCSVQGTSVTRRSIILELLQCNIIYKSTSESPMLSSLLNFS